MLVFITIHKSLSYILGHVASWSCLRSEAILFIVALKSTRMLGHLRRSRRPEIRQSGPAWRCRLRARNAGAQPPCAFPLEQTRVHLRYSLPHIAAIMPFAAEMLCALSYVRPALAP